MRPANAALAHSSCSAKTPGLGTLRERACMNLLECAIELLLGYILVDIGAKDTVCSIV